MQLLDYLMNQTLLDEDELVKFVVTAPRRYKKYQIPKRNSNEFRQIAQPSKEVKFLQRIGVEFLENHLSISDVATAYIKGIGIKENAQIHAKSQYLLKMDFRHFFPSISPDVFITAIHQQGFAVGEKDAHIIRHLFFWIPDKDSNLQLSVGAPSSPFISNVAMFSFDNVLSEYCREHNISYSRYADDLTFSTNIKHNMTNLPTFVDETIRAGSEAAIMVNPAKTVFASKAVNRHVTGVTISNNGCLSIGRHRKRYISSMIHKYSLNLLEHEEIAQLSGLLAFAKHIEPIFIYRMKKKYGCMRIDNLFKFSAES